MQARRPVARLPRVLAVGNLTVLAEVLRADRVPFGVGGHWATCSLYANLRAPHRRELVSHLFDGAWLASAARAIP